MRFLAAILLSGVLWAEVRMNVEQLRAFIQCLRDGAPPPVSGEDGRQAILVGLAARKSHAENRPVRLAELAASWGTRPDRGCGATGAL